MWQILVLLAGCGFQGKKSFALDSPTYILTMCKAGGWAILILLQTIAAQNRQTGVEFHDPYEFANILQRNLEPWIGEEKGCEQPYSNNVMYYFGLQEINGWQFWRLFSVCYDKDTRTPVLSSHRLSSSIPNMKPEGTHDIYLTEKLDTTVPAPEFYSCRTQVDTLRRLLGSEVQARKFISCSVGQIFAPTQLVPKDDFPFELQRRTTLYYLNTVPVWQIIRDGNWRNLEDTIRRYAVQRQRTLTVRSGVLKIAQLPDINKEQRQLFMTAESSGLIVPVPRLLWKLVYDPVEVAGIVFVGVNNPFRKHPLEMFIFGEVLCRCVCNQTSAWFDSTWNRMDLKKGYIYCCSLFDFARATNMRFVTSASLLGK